MMSLKEAAVELKIPVNTLLNAARKVDAVITNNVPGQGDIYVDIEKISAVVEEQIKEQLMYLNNIPQEV